MVKHFTAISIVALVLHVWGVSQAATFNVTTPAEFQTALTTAQANGQDDTIHVSAGTYHIGATLTYQTVQNFDLDIVGAGASATILDGGGSVQIMNLTGSGGGDISVSGLTLQRGRNGEIGGLGGAFFANNSADGSIAIDSCIVTNSTSLKNTGGAWLGAVNGNLTVTHSSFTHNSCDEGTADDGCGLYLYFDTATATGNAVVRYNDISFNTLNTNPAPIGNCDGAGLMIYHLGTSGDGPTFHIENNTITSNLSYEGVAGMSLHLLHWDNTIVIAGNTFSENVSGPIPSGMPIQIFGSGAHVYSEGGTIMINNNTFINNINHDPYGLGAGLCLEYMPRGTLQMVGNVFAGNQNDGIGGGLVLGLGDDVTSANMVQNLFVDNQAGMIEGSGGGLSLSSSVDVNLVNNTFYNNYAADGGGMTYYAEAAADVAWLFNEIYWANTPNAVSVFAPGPVQAAYSNIEGGSGQTYFGGGCIDSEPLFCNAADPPGADGIYATPDDGLRLGPGSPSINAGSNTAVPGEVTTDIAGQIRIQDGIVDMGAYESPGSAAPIAQFSGDPVSGTAPLAVAFSDLSIGTIDTWSWDFGDGITSTDQNPTHIYQTPGVYTVTLTVAGPSGSDTETKADYIAVANGAATTDIKANGSDGPVTLPNGTTVSVTVGLTPAEYAGFNADWWIAVHTPFAPPGDWYSYVHPTGWMPGVHRCVQTPLFEFSGFEALDMALPVGNYTFYFAVDPPDGIPTAELLDSVAVTVTP